MGPARGAASPPVATPPLFRPWRVVILAAGQGRRFAMATPKMLVPVQAGQGLLELLLRDLLERQHHPPERITVVAAAAAPHLAPLLERLDRRLNLVCLSGLSRGVLHSLATAVAPHPPESSWVLHADTHYPSAMLARLLARPCPGVPLLSLAAAPPEEPLEVGVRLGTDGRVAALGPGAGWPWRMLPAVAWPARLIPALQDPCHGSWSQWQLLAALLRSPSPLGPEALRPEALLLEGALPFDIDTVDAWRQACAALVAAGC